MFPFCDFHEPRLHGSQIVSGLVVFVACPAIAAALHKILWLYIQFSHTVDDNMDVNVTTAIMTIHVGADKSLVSRKEVPGKFQAESLGLLTGQARILFISWVKADDIVMGFNVFPFLVFVIVGVKLLTFFIKREGVAVDSVQIIFFPENSIAIRIQNRFLSTLVVLEDQVFQSFSIISIFTGEMFQYRYEIHLPFSLQFYAFP